MNKNNMIKRFSKMLLLTTAILFTPQSYAGPPIEDNEHTAVLRVLTEDGGAIRGPHTEGVFTWELWHAANDKPIPADETIEPVRKVQEKLDIPFSQFFHGYAGTSVGSIQAAAFAAGVTIDQYHEILEAKEQDIFKDKRSSWWGGGTVIPYYKAEGIEEILKDIIGGTMLSDIDHCLLMIVSNNPSTNKPVYFKNWEARDSLGTVIPSKDLSIVDAIIASMSPFPYFAPRTVTYADGHTEVDIDGGFGTNNPGLTAWIHINKDLLRRGILTTPEKATKMQVLSLGTGEFDAPYKVENLYETIQYTVATSTSSKKDEMLLADAAPDGHYYRWNVPLTAEENVFDSGDAALLAGMSAKSHQAWHDWEHKDEMVKIFSVSRSTEISHPWIDFSKVPIRPEGK